MKSKFLTGEKHMQTDSKQVQSWTFLTNHTHVLLCLCIDSGMRMKDIASRVGITERAVQAIIHDLIEGGFIDRIHEGRRNKYVLHPERNLKHTMESHRQIKDLMQLIEDKITD